MGLLPTLPHSRRVRSPAPTLRLGCRSRLATSIHALRDRAVLAAASNALATAQRPAHRRLLIAHQGALCGVLPLWRLHRCLPLAPHHLIHPSKPRERVWPLLCGSKHAEPAPPLPDLLIPPASSWLPRLVLLLLLLERRQGRSKAATRCRRLRLHSWCDSSLGLRRLRSLRRLILGRLPLLLLLSMLQRCVLLHVLLRRQQLCELRLIQAADLRCGEGCEPAEALRPRPRGLLCACRWLGAPFQAQAAQLGCQGRVRPLCRRSEALHHCRAADGGSAAPLLGLQGQQ